jgi:prepilin-type N-terminal cleavage/methylation domain-containing protein
MLCLGGLCHIPNWVRFAGHKTKRGALGSIVKNQSGFTLIEVIAVLVIASVLGAITFSKAEALSQSASLRAIEDGVRELNSREMVSWANIKLSDHGWVDDATVFASMDADLGAAFHWTPRAGSSGGRLHFKEFAVILTRAPSENTAAGRWAISR